MIISSQFFKLNPLSENTIAKCKMDSDNELPIGKRTWTFVMAEGDGRLFCRLNRLLIKA